ncbi:MAG: hypothetical protein KAR20_15025, partial [Candidatus Heimdallarchaeota archaeon]|nr:hypothetical protein [Candidatus Heimdallarchaeota archaeon]
FVSPIPDDRLAIVGNSIITEDINSSQTNIPIQSPDFFNQYKNNNLKTVKIGNELIRYGKVSEEEPWILMNCQRAAFDTKSNAHSSGSTISKLSDHAYKVFLTSTELSFEMSENIARLFNETGLRQISFDGLEGCRSTGLGNYGEILFAKNWYDHLSDDIKQHYIADASRTTHDFWHIYTRMNWGEPWYAGFRESQTEYRLKNQKYFKRNLMPGMLGWFKMTSETSIEDIEWLLARSAAFDAGYAFVCNYQSLEENGNTKRILELIGEWEQLRLARAFSDDQKSRMEDIKNEFQLSKAKDQDWQFQQVYSYKFVHEHKILQPGEPVFSTFEFSNPAKEQKLKFIISNGDQKIENIRFEIDNYNEIIIPVKIAAGHILKYEGNETAT